MSPGWHGSWGMAGSWREQWVPGHLSGFTWQLARLCGAFQESQRPLEAPLRLAHCFYWPKGVGSTARVRGGETQGPSCRQELRSHCHGAQRWGRPGSASGCRSTRQPRLHHHVTQQTSHLAFAVGGRRVQGGQSLQDSGALTSNSFSLNLGIISTRERKHGPNSFHFSLARQSSCS